MPEPDRLANSIFATLPERFFAPLASPSRELNALALVRFYRLFQDWQTALERVVVANDFERWLETQADLAWTDEADDSEVELLSDSGESPQRRHVSILIRRLTRSGWILEEDSADFKRLLAMPDYAVPFYQALAQTAAGLAPEYEGRIFGIYQNLSGPGAREHGDLALRAALEQTRQLSESIKSLEQSIKNHLERLFAKDLAIPDILRAHYQDYQRQVIDSIYNRIKTSDHLSRFRPVILSQIRQYLDDQQWLDQSGRQWAKRQGQSLDQARACLVVFDRRPEAASLPWEQKLLTQVEQRDGKDILVVGL